MKAAIQNDYEEHGLDENPPSRTPSVCSQPRTPFRVSSRQQSASTRRTTPQWTSKPIPASPALSSPTPSETSRHQHNSGFNTYENEITHTSNGKRGITTKVRLETTGKATQTPKYLASTLKPSLKLPHKTISEEQMRRLMQSRKHAIARPNWKP